VSDPIQAVVFDCYGTLVDFGDDRFEWAYGKICSEQGLDVSGKAFFDKWMEVWRRFEPPENVVVAHNDPGPLSEPEPSLNERVQRLSGGRNRSLSGPPPPFRPYRDEWPEHFGICFEELGVPGDPDRASEQLRVLLGQAPAYPEVKRVVDELAHRRPVAVLSNADNDFLHPCLEFNGLGFEIVVSSEDVLAYKPHFSIFQATSDALKLPLTTILYVGDSRTADVIGSKHAGMRSAWINRRGLAFHPTEGEARPFEPDYEMGTLEDLLSIVE
jgi:2-haloalkanoic acid dehalogenase type II